MRLTFFNSNQLPGPMVIRSRTIRLGIFVSTIVIAAIIVFQLIWLRKVYHFEQKQFDHAIAKTVRGFYEDLNLPLFQNTNLNELIESPNSQTFLVRTGVTRLHPDSVRFYMQSELEDEDVFTDCYLGIFDSSRGAYTLQVYLPAATGTSQQKIALPAPYRSYSHLTLYFPHRKQYILSLMSFWITTSIILLIVLILFGGALYYFYRQKFLNETQKDFVNNFTHEFKTPVSVINLAADVLARPEIVDKPEKLAKYAAIVQYQGHYLQEQIEKLLRYAYAESNLLQLHREEVDLHRLIQEALNNLQPLIQQKGAQVQCTLEAVNPVLFADRGYLLIVLTNLIENSLKYSEKPRIVVSTANENGGVLVSVKDNGRGIEPKYKNKVFKKFYRVPNGEQVSARGFGLGLAFVKRIVDSHKGKISVDSIHGVGSDFRVRLPHE